MSRYLSLISLLSFSLFLISACGSSYVEKKIINMATDVGGDLVVYGIEIECFKFEFQRWPLRFSEMEIYQPQVLPCVGLENNSQELWTTYPSAEIKAINEDKALIIIKEKRLKDGSFKPLEKPIHINYQIDYQQKFTHVKDQ